MDIGRQSLLLKIQALAIINGKDFLLQFPLLVLLFLMMLNLLLVTAVMHGRFGNLINVVNDEDKFFCIALIFNNKECV